MIKQGEMMKLIKPQSLFILLWAIILSLPATVMAQTAEEQGLAIAKEFDQRDIGFSDLTAKLEMVLTNRHGATSKRFIRLKTLEVEGDGDKSLSIFDRPKDVKGTAMLTYSHGLKADDQWLYLPALKRVKRISSKNKSGPFMGSEFAFEDLSSQELEKYSYRYIKDEVLEGQDCYVVERIPAYKHSGYKRQMVWFDKAEYRPIKIVYYDRKDSLLKTLNYTQYQQYAGQYWRADLMDMVNHQTGKSTRLYWRDYQFKTGLTVRDFDRNSLKRAR